MAAGLGFKDFQTGEVLTAADVDGYLMQGIWVFASAAARDAAVTSPQEGNSCYLKDTDVIQVYSGSSWVVKSGGSSPLTTKGDLYTYSTTDARLAVGANGTTLVADSAEATGLKWATPSSGSGLTLIQRSSFSNVAGTSTTFDGVFTSTYVTYLIDIENLSSATAGDDKQFVFRISGSDGSAHYGNCMENNFNANTWTSTSSSNIGQVTIYTANASSSEPLSAQIFVNDIGTNKLPNMNGAGFGLGDQKYALFYGVNNVANTYTGFRLKSASTNITGTVAVYGLAK